MRLASSIARVLILTATASQVAAQNPLQPTELAARHVSGQTFITWREVPGITDESYLVYRSTSGPIVDSTSLAGSQFLAEVWEGSAQFWGDREYRDNLAWTARYFARLVVPTSGGSRMLDADEGVLVWTLDAVTDLPNGPAQAWYAVVTRHNGITNVQDFKCGNSTCSDASCATACPANESVADPEPVVGVDFSPSNCPCPAAPGCAPNATCDTGTIYVQYMDYRDWNGTLHVPNTRNNYFNLGSPGSLPAGVLNARAYAYCYKVTWPTSGPAPADGWPVTLILHPHGGDRFRIQFDASPFEAIEIEPIDSGDTWWFGFARGYDYRNPTGVNVPAGTMVSNYTEQRLLRMVHDLLRSDPCIANPQVPCEIDEQRVYVYGLSMGGSGALALATRYPEVFAAAHAAQPMTDYEAFVYDMGSEPNCMFAQELIQLWGDPVHQNQTQLVFAGPPEWAMSTAGYSMNVWEWQNHRGQVATRTADEMVPFGLTHGMRDCCLPANNQMQPFHPAAFLAKRCAGLYVDNSGHGVGARNGFPYPLRELTSGGPTGPFHGLAVVKNESVPGLSNLYYSSGSQPCQPAWTCPDRCNAPANCANYCPTTNTNPYRPFHDIGWDASWNSTNPPAEQTDSWTIRLWSVSSASYLVDVTPRRCQQFTVNCSKQYAWMNLEQGYIGYTACDANGVLTVPGFLVTPGGNTLVLYEL